MKTRESKTKRKANTFIEYFTLCIILLFSQAIARAAETGYIKLDWCDNATGWGGAHTIIIDTENNMQGTGCLSSTGDNLVSFSKVYSPLNTYLSEDEGYLKFWLYISDVSLFDNTGQIEITSSGGFDVDEYSWNMNSLYLKDGWNYMVLNLASANKNGSPDLSAINFFRLYSYYTGPVTVKIDHIIFDDEVGTPLPGNYLDPCNHTTGWSGNDDIYLDMDNNIDGYASLASLGEGTNRFIKVLTPKDANVSFENGYLTFWFYVSDITALDAIGQVEITSSGGYDVDEYSWPLNCLDLQNGWNYVYLKLANANKTGDPDLTAINYFRLYNFMNDTVLLRLDEIRFTENPPPKPHIVNPNTLQDKVLFGYQGWFAAPGDGSLRNQWVHWFNNNTPDADNVHFDTWPDMSEYDEDELFETDMEYSNGDPVKLYSAYRYNTVDIHFKWMYEHQLDGVFLQRFIALTRWEGGLEFIDKVAANVIKSCNKYERVFAIEFCIQENEDYWVETIKNDWMHLVDDLNVTLSPWYLKHKGRPLVGIYGIGFDMYSYATPEEAQELIDWFHSGAPEKYRATVMCGVPESWRSDGDYIDFYTTVDVIKPWTVGRYGDYGSADNFLNNYILPDKDFCDAHNMDYLPVIWPGSSRYNMSNGSYLINKFPRNGGNFYWRQSYNVNRAGVNMIFIAMFDEVDEGTAMYKLEPHLENTPTTGTWLALDADGYELPSDWYLRLVSETARTVRKEIANDYIIPEIPNVKSVDSLHVASGIYPEVALPEELHACAQESREVHAIISNASWQNWSVGGSGTSANIYCDQSKEIWVEAGNTCGNASDTMNLVVMPNPVITLGADDTITSGQSILISVADDYVRYLWNDVPGDSSFLADNTTLDPGANDIELTVVDHHNCSASDNQSIYLLIPTGTREPINFNEKVLVFPNPFNNSIHIVFNEDEANDLNAASKDLKQMQISLYNSQGRKIITRQSINGNVLSLDLGSLPGGNYFLQISAGENKKVIKVVKDL
jgi:hypothetical protein